MLRGGPVRWNLYSTSARRWKEKGVGTFPIHIGYQIQLTEGLSFLPKDPTWAPSVRLSCWRWDEQTPSLTFIVFDLNFRSLGLSLQQYVDCGFGPFQTLEYRCFRSHQRPQTAPLKLSPLRSHSETAAPCMF